MIELEGLQETLGEIGEDIATFVKEKPLATAGIGAAAVGMTAVGVMMVKGRGKKAGKRKTTRTKKGRKRDYKYRSKQKHELAYVKRKRKAGKKITRPRYKKKESKKRPGIHYTKKGQPYKILASGKARFIKKTKRR